ncbi:hypothetical protein [Thiorhodococcus minor]|uniref:Uncharacterized protein n=1 Tax=Thiorhodococcus minor TaxID=57489 RepID=A0A6M0K679_9GAMM|nr:hypothetical protein [Thiorhodococcus minor]NEV64949.1 hypothetical protein [Thiorhodococcus minor]
MRTILTLLAVLGALWVGAFWAIMGLDADPIDASLSHEEPVTAGSQTDARPAGERTDSAGPLTAHWEPGRAGSRDARPDWSLPVAAVTADDEPAEPEIPAAFPLSEWEWTDVDPDDVWLEPAPDDAFTMEPDPFGNPWGGDWRDQGGG